jgi:hypothetical protein
VKQATYLWAGVAGIVAGIVTLLMYFEVRPGCARRAETIAVQNATQKPLVPTDTVRPVNTTQSSRVDTVKIAVPQPDTARSESVKVATEKHSTPTTRTDQPSPKGWRLGSEVRGYNGK